METSVGPVPRKVLIPGDPFGSDKLPQDEITYSPSNHIYHSSLSLPSDGSSNVQGDVIPTQIGGVMTGKNGGILKYDLGL